MGDFNHTDNNKRIAKNTLALYLRMFFVMAVGLYTSRVVLQTLGIDDYGIYNVVGGFVAMLAYLNKVFVSATQRFLSFTLGENNPAKLKSVFSTSITVHIIISVAILVVGETLGLWFVNEKLVIAPERLYAANWVYQCSLLSLIITVVSVPYNASVVSHERMHIYAYFGIAEAVLKLAIVYLLLVSNYDRLIVYAVLHLMVSLIIPIWNVLYCKKQFEECAFHLFLDKPLFKEMISFSVWTLIGSLGFSFKDQLSNIIMNIFIGTTINAARGVASQVNGIVMSFAENFTIALSPQITKQYAAGDVQHCQRLVSAGSRISFYLMSLIIIPIIININYILHLWLGVVPEYTNIFIIISLIASAYYSATKTLTTALMATGDIKWFQIGVTVIMLLELPIAYFILKLGHPPYYALMPAILTNVAGLFFRICLVKKQIPAFNAKKFIWDAVIKSTILMGTAFICAFFINKCFEIDFVMLIVSSTISIIIICLLVYMLGISKIERKYINSFVLSKLQRQL